MAIKTRAANVRRIPESERWDADRQFALRFVPWSPDGSDSAFDIHVATLRGDGASLLGRSADGKQSGKDLPSQSRLRTMGHQ